MNTWIYTLMYVDDVRCRAGSDITDDVDYLLSINLLFNLAVVYIHECFTASLYILLWAG